LILDPIVPPTTVLLEVIRPAGQFWDDFASILEFHDFLASVRYLDVVHARGGRCGGEGGVRRHFSRR
jgi:hypothetical protein